MRAGRGDWIGSFHMYVEFKMAQQLRHCLGSSHLDLSTSFCFWFQCLAYVPPGRQQVKAQVAGSLSLMWDLDGVPGSWPQFGPALAFVDIRRVNQHMEYLNLHPQTPQLKNKLMAQRRYKWKCSWSIWKHQNSIWVSWELKFRNHMHRGASSRHGKYRVFWVIGQKRRAEC